jgi:hypothetical protein
MINSTRMPRGGDTEQARQGEEIQIKVVVQMKISEDKG